MRKQSLFDRYEILVAGAIIASHVVTAIQGFRPRDVRFFLELFSNWVEFSFGGGVLEFGNVQVCRYLETLVREGYAKKKISSTRKSYQLTRSGIIEMISRVILPGNPQPFELFCFQVCLATGYGELARKEILRQGEQFPPALRIEVDELLDIPRLFARRQLAIEKEIRKLEARAKDGLNSGKLAEQLMTEGKPLKEIIAKIKHLHPYQMSSQKSLDELIALLPKEIQAWELAEGAAARSELLFYPAITALKTELTSLAKMQSRIEKLQAAPKKFA